MGSYITTAMSLFSLKVSAWIRLYGIVSNAGQKLWSEVKHDANNKYTFQVNKTIPLERVFFCNNSDISPGLVCQLVASVWIPLMILDMLQKH